MQILVFTRVQTRNNFWRKLKWFVLGRIERVLSNITCGDWAQKQFQITKLFRTYCYLVTVLESEMLREPNRFVSLCLRRQKSACMIRVVHTFDTSWEMLHLHPRRWNLASADRLVKFETHLNFTAVCTLTDNHAIQGTYQLHLAARYSMVSFKLAT